MSTVFCSVKFQNFTVSKSCSSA